MGLFEKIFRLANPKYGSNLANRRIKLPEDFDEESYLALNPDLQVCGVDAANHYLNHGYAEGRKYKKSSRKLLPILAGLYDHDGLKSIHNHDFMIEKEFIKAYKRGVHACGEDYNWYWRVHIGLWAARTSLGVKGDFVECGVNRGFLSSAIMDSVEWDRVGKIFYLLDTFSGIDKNLISDLEHEGGILERNKHELDSGFYTSNFESVENNFSEWSNKKIIVGSVPGTLRQITSDKIAFLHLDMNCSPPEVAAIDYLWNRIETGGIVLLDDYAYYGYQPQKEGMDSWAKSKGISIASLPTGQGLIIKT